MVGLCIHNNYNNENMPICHVKHIQISMSNTIEIIIYSNKIVA